MFQYNPFTQTPSSDNCRSRLGVHHENTRLLRVSLHQYLVLLVQCTRYQRGHHKYKASSVRILIHRARSHAPRWSTSKLRHDPSSTTLFPSALPTPPNHHTKSKMSFL